MTQLLTASFANQGRAAAAVEKLLAHGLPRAQVRIRTDESVGNSAASSDTPTTVVSDISDAGKREAAGHLPHSRSPLEATAPEELGRATVFVAVAGELSNDQIRDILTSAGAFSVESGDAALPDENPGMSPVIDTGDPGDVRKAIDAARAGHPEI